jgi:hypothetical protein
MLLELLKKEFWNMELLEKKKRGRGEKKKKKRAKKHYSGQWCFWW